MKARYWPWVSVKEVEVDIRLAIRSKVRKSQYEFRYRVTLSVEERYELVGLVQAERSPRVG